MRYLESPRCLPALLAALLCALGLAGCGGGGSWNGEDQALKATALYQFVYRPGTGRYEFGYDSISRIAIEQGEGLDPARFAMAHDGRSFYLFLGVEGSPNVLRVYSFAGTYIDSGLLPVLMNVPPDANMARIAALHDGSYFRIYTRSLSNPRVMHQWRSASVGGPFTRDSSWNTAGGPPDADFTRWAMFHNGSTYIQAVFRRGSRDTLYQYGFNGREYAFGHNARETIQLIDTPADAHTSQVAILHDGRRYRAYLLAP